MDREGFKNRLKQYKKAREENPGLKYWEWRNTVSTEENPIYYDELTELDEQLNEAESLIKEYNEIENNLVNKRDCLSELHKVPYLKDKEIILSNAGSMTGARLTTNLLDSIAKYADKTGLPLQEAIGLAALESTFGQKMRLNNRILDNKNTDDYVVENILSDWRYKSRNVNEYLTDKLNQPSKEAKQLALDHYDYVTSWNTRPTPDLLHESRILAKRESLQHTNDKIDFLINYYNDFEKAWSDYEEKTVPPFEHAFEYYKTGKYNPADSTHTDMVKLKGEEVMRSPEFKKWAKENSIKYAEGGEVTGPPTYDDWYTDITIPKLNAFDDAYLHVNINDAAADLHNIAMTLPGYANKWNEYQRSRPKEDPSIDTFVNDLWANENPNNVGYRNGKYYPHKSPEGGKMTIGPGFKLDSGSHGISTKTANRGMTKTRLNQEARKIGKQHLAAVDQFLNYGLTTNPADTVSPQIKMGLMDLRHLVGPLNEWGNLRQAVLNGDLEGIRKESTVTWNDNGKIKVDKRRKKIRDEKYFYYE